MYNKGRLKALSKQNYEFLSFIDWVHEFADPELCKTMNWVEVRAVYEKDDRNVDKWIKPLMWLLLNKFC